LLRDQAALTTFFPLIFPTFGPRAWSVEEESLRDPSDGVNQAPGMMLERISGSGREAPRPISL
ncbi:MAG: hypothetical protein RSE34_09025, partial [Brevundimonas sp.]